MSNTSDQTTKQNDKTRLIVGEVGIDTETGIVGKGHSYDNGKTFTVDDTIYGRIYHADDHDKIWKGIQDQVVKVVDPAKSAADSAVSAADAAVASAQSDVSKAFTQIADTANALSDAKTAFNSDVAEAKNLASTAQTTADNAIKSAASVASDLTAVASQAKANASGITKVTSDVGLLQTTVADNSGNISTIQETTKQIQQAVSDNSGNITVAKQTADSAVAVASDARSNATVAIQTASQASITAQNASGQAASAVLTANGAMTTASNAKSDATVAIQTASGASLTATNAQSDATIAKQTASEATVQASNADSDFTQLSIRANKIEANVATNSGAIASVQQTADGIKSTVATKADQSTVTQLSNAIQSKVESSTYTSAISQLSNDINLRVKSADLISQINLQAGTALIQSNKLVLDAGTTVFTGDAFIPSAAIANLTADQIQAGTLSGSKVHAGDNNGNGIDMGVLSDNYVGLKAYANNGDHTDIDLNGIHNYGASYDTRIQQGKITTNYLAVNGGGMIDFRDSNGTGMIAEGLALKFDVRNISTGYLSYSGAPLADWPDGSIGNELKIMYGESLAIAANSDTNSRALFSTVNTQIGYYQQGDTPSNWGLTGLKIDNTDRQINLGVYGSDGKWARLLANPGSVELNASDNNGDAHCHLDSSRLHFYKDNDNNSATAVELQVDGWTWVRGYVEAMGLSQHSVLSAKTRIEQADSEHMLDLINQTELTTFAYTAEVADGTDFRHIGPIIDDVHDIAEYQIPSEFVAPTKTARDDGNIVGALIGAVQALTKRIKKLEDKLNG